MKKGHYIVIIVVLVLSYALALWIGMGIGVNMLVDTMRETGDYETLCRLMIQ